MKTLEESIATAMEIDYLEHQVLFPHLPYILQDSWELGTPPETVINIIQKHCKDYSTLRILDLGCGKGAVSVKLAIALKCNCYGIDGIPEFIETAKAKAQEYGVETLCRFEVGDIREKIKTSGKFDVIILGAIGQVFGDYYATLSTLSEHLNPNGIIIINDAYADDSIEFKHPLVLHLRELLKQTQQAGMELIDECTDSPTNYGEDYKNLKKRCEELMTKYPEKTSIFESYAHSQVDEYEALENRMICSMMVFKKSTLKVKFVCPLITVADMKVSRNFYENILGQTVEADYGENVSFGGFAIHLQPHFKMLINNKEIVSGANNFELYFEYDNLEQIYERLKAEKVEFIHELREEPWKQWVFRFYDPDKNIIDIGESMERLVLRLYQQNNSADEIFGMTGLNKDFIENTISKI